MELKELLFLCPGIHGVVSHVIRLKWLYTEASVSVTVSVFLFLFRSRVAVKHFHYTAPKRAMIYASYEGKQLECRFKYEQGPFGRPFWIRLIQLMTGVIKNGMLLRTVHDRPLRMWILLRIVCGRCVVNASAFAAVISFVYCSSTGK